MMVINKDVCKDVICLVIAMEEENHLILFIFISLHIFV